MQKWLLGLGISGLALVASVAACSSSTSNPYPDVPSFCAAKAKAECQIAATCTVDATACQNARTTICTQDAATAQAGGRRVYASDNVQGCLDKINGVYAHPPIVFADLEGPGSVQDKCERVFSGKADTNQAC